MRKPIMLPDLGTNDIVFNLWHVEEGAIVHEGERVAEVMFPAVSVDVEAPYTGRIMQCDARPRQRLDVGQILGFMLVEPTEAD